MRAKPVSAGYQDHDSMPCRPQYDNEQYKKQAMQVSKDIATVNGPLQLFSSTELGDIWGLVPAA
jgi:hypothetical protein